MKAFILIILSKNMEIKMDNITSKMHTILSAGHHLLIEGSSGAGKTYRVSKLLDSMDANYNLVNAASINNADDLICLIYNEDKKESCDILVIDEVHNLNNKLQNIMLTFLEKGEIHGKHLVLTSSKYIQCVGITTNGELLFKPFRNRFLPVYVPLPTDEEKYQYLNTYLSWASELDKRYIIKSAVSYRHLYQITTLANNVKDVKKAMKTLQYDENGTNEHERQYLYALNKIGTASIHSIASAMCVDVDTAKNIEMNLIRKNMIAISSKGRRTVNKGVLYKE